jgi:hypothetical protein
MFINRMAAASVAAVGLFSLGCAALANPIVPIQGVNQVASMNAGQFLKVTDDQRSGYTHKRHRRRIAQSHDWQRRQNSGPPYDSCYMKCINSSHPADFCQAVSHEHFCY